MRKRHASIVRGVVVPVRIVRDPEARELRAAPSEGDDLDDEDEENADQRYRECVRLKMERSIVRRRRENGTYGYCVYVTLPFSMLPVIGGGFATTSLS